MGAQTNPSRATVEGWIETLIEYLDGIDSDPDLEDTGDDEPYMSAGATGMMSAGNFDDREQEYR